MSDSNSKTIDHRRVAERIHDAVASSFQIKGASYGDETMPYVRRAWARIPEGQWDLPEDNRLRMLRETYVTMIEEILKDG